MEDFLVTVKDARSIKYCKDGTRKFFEKHNLDWNKFVKVGISAKQVIETGDAMAIELVEAAHGRK